MNAKVHSKFEERGAAVVLLADRRARRELALALAHVQRAREELDAARCALRRAYDTTIDRRSRDEAHVGLLRLGLLQYYARDVARRVARVIDLDLLR